MTKQVTLYCDSGLNEGCVVAAGNGAQGIWFCTYPEPVTVNVGEYKAVLLALKTAHLNRMDNIRMLTDSKLVVEQVHGRWKCKQAHLVELRDAVCQGLDTFRRWELAWISREENPAGQILERREKLRKSCAKSKK